MIGNLTREGGGAQRFPLLRRLFPEFMFEKVQINNKNPNISQKINVGKREAIITRGNGKGAGSLVGRAETEGGRRKNSEREKGDRRFGQNSTAFCSKKRILIVS